MKRFVVPVICALVLCLASAAFAQSPPTIDWTANATAVKDSLTGVLALILPVAVAILVLFMGRGCSASSSSRSRTANERRSVVGPVSVEGSGPGLFSRRVKGRRYA